MKNTIIILVVSQCLCIIALAVVAHDIRTRITALQDQQKTDIDTLYRMFEDLSDTQHIRGMELKRMLQEYRLEAQGLRVKSARDKHSADRRH